MRCSGTDHQRTRCIRDHRNRVHLPDHRHRLPAPKFSHTGTLPKGITAKNSAGTTSQQFTLTVS
jgi:hypothetical protein